MLITLAVKCNVILNLNLPSGKKKIKIELEDENGEKYNLSLQGNLSKEKIMNVIEFVQTFEKNQIDGVFEHKENGTKLGSKLWNLIIENFRYHTFTSSDLSKIYKEVFYESMQLSIISIYLSRFYHKKQLNRTKNGKQWVYTLVKDIQNYDKQTNETFNQSSLLSLPTVYDLHL